MFIRPRALHLLVFIPRVAYCDIDPHIQVTRLGFFLHDIQIGSIAELTPAGPIGTNPPITTSAVQFLYGFDRALWITSFTPSPSPSHPVLSDCLNHDPNATPCCWSQYLSGAITLDQWSVLNPGFATMSPGNPSLPLIPINLHQVCLANPPYIYTPENTYAWYPKFTHYFWANQDTARIDMRWPSLLISTIGHGPHTSVTFSTSTWTWHPCDLNGDGLRDNLDLQRYDSNPYDWNLDGFINKDDRTHLSQCLITCYPDCDANGTLGANDFVCYLNAYTLGESYADCDIVPGLTANDFLCFLTRYTIGCS